MRILKSILLGAMLSASLCASAVPANPRPVVFTQPDGTEVSLRLIGDEFSHYYVTDDEKVVLGSNDGGFYFAELDAPSGQVRPSKVLAANAGRRDALQMAAATKVSVIQMARQAQSNREKAKRLRTVADPSAPMKSAPMLASSGSWVGKGLFSTANFPTTGSPKLLVILVQYSDVSFTSYSSNGTYFDGLLNTPGFSTSSATGSARDYFSDCSNGVFTPDFDVYGPVTLPNTRAYYGANDSDGNDVKAEYMVKDAIELLDSTVDFSAYDTDSDGYIDNVYVVYAGLGEANGGVANTVWPHSWDLVSAGITLYADGKRVKKYACSAELYSSSKPEGIGTFCHEFGHVLGLADEYATDYGSADTLHPDSYSIMASGSYNNSGRTPPTYSIFQRNALSWADLEQLDTTPRTIVMGHTLSTNKGYVIPTSSANEFFLIENRQKSSWDAYLPGHGMLIWHIDYLASTWNSNSPNNTATHQRIDIEEANGSANNESSTTMAKYPFPGTSGKTSFTDTTTPNMKTWSGTSLGIPLTNITEKSNGDISFDVCGGGTYVGTPTLNASGAMTCNNVFTLTATPASADDTVNYIMMTNTDIYEGTIDSSLEISEDCEIEVWSERENVESEKISLTFTFKCADVAISPNGGSYMTIPQISLSSATNGARIYYTTDGSTPTTSSTLYTAPFSPSATCTVKAIAAYGNWSNSTVSSATFSKIEQQSGATTYNLYQVWNTAGLTTSGTWSSSYNNITLSYPCMTVKMTAAHQTTTITDYPVTKGSAITIDMAAGCVPIRQFAMTFVKWSTKNQTVSLSYTTNGTSYTTIDGASIDTTDGTLMLNCTSIPESATGLKVTFSGTNQIGLESITVAYGEAEVIDPGTQDTVVTPTFTPDSGEVAAGTTVAIACAIDGATIYYTTDGNEPTTSSAAYVSPIAINSEMTIKAIAARNGWNNSEVATANYTVTAVVDPELPDGAFAIVYKDMSSTSEITSSNYGATVQSGSAIATYGSATKVYEGSSGLRFSSTKASGSLTINLAAAYQRNISHVVIRGILYNSSAASLTVNGSASQSFTSTLADYTYNLDGSTLTSLKLAATGRLYVKSITFYEGTPKPDAPSITVVSDIDDSDTEFYEEVLVEFDTYQGSIYYTLDGTSDPTVDSASRTLYEDSTVFDFTETTTLKWAGLVAGEYSEVMTQTFTKIDPPAPETVATPTFTPVSGTEVEAGATVAIVCATDGATIHYTTDGTEPTASSTTYSTPLSVSGNVGGTFTIKAIAVKDGMNDSAVATATYTIKETAGGGGGGGSTEETDTLTFTTMKLTNTTSYAVHSDIKLVSDAVYYAQCAGDAKTIQLRSSNSNSGIVSTTSGGKLTKVSVKWNSKTSSGRSVDIYGSNAAYTAPSNLYSTSTQGTHLGSISYDTDGSIDVTGDYTYFGIRSNSDALYLDEVAVTWSNGPAKPASPVIDIASDKDDSETEFYDLAVVGFDPYSSNPIYYTLDGSDPSDAENANRVSYKDAFDITETTTISYVGYVDGEYSKVESATLTKVARPTVATPTFSTATGNLVVDSTVSIACATDGATIRYTLDGTTPNSESATYSSEIAIPGSVGAVVTLKAYATKEGMLDSEVATATYTIVDVLVYELATSSTEFADGDKIIIAAKDYAYALSTTQNSNNRGQAEIEVTASDTVEDPADGVEILTLEEGTSGFYLRGKDGNYLCAASSGSNWLRSEDSQTKNSLATISVTTSATTITFATSIYSRNVVQYNNSSSIFACYSSASQKAIRIFKLKAASTPPIVDVNTVATPTFSPAAGEVAVGTKVSIACATAEATIYYTTDGSEPTTSSTPYADAITITEAMTIKAIATKADMTDSAIATAAYTLAADNVEDAYVLVSDATTLQAGDKVVIAAQLGTKWYALIPESESVVEATVSNSIITVTSSMENFVVEATGNANYPWALHSVEQDMYVGNGSANKSLEYSSDILTGYMMAYNPAQTLNSLKFNSSSKPYLMLNGTTTPPLSRFYETPTSQTDLYAGFRLFRENKPRVVTPYFTPNGGEIEAGETVSIACDTEGASIYYTTDGTEPTAASTLYTASIEVSKAMTIKAIAIKSGMRNSVVASASFTILGEEPSEPEVDEPLTASIDSFVFSTAKDGDGNGAYGMLVHSSTVESGSYNTDDVACVELLARLTISGNSRLWENKGVINLRTYAGASFTIKAVEHYKIISATINCNNPGYWTSTDSALADGEWSGRADEITLNCSGSDQVMSVNLEMLEMPKFSLEDRKFVHANDKTVTFSTTIHKAYDSHVKRIEVWVVEVPTATPAGALRADGTVTLVGSATVDGSNADPQVDVEVPLSIDPDSGVHTVKVRTAATLYDNSTEMSTQFVDGQPDGSTGEYAYSVDTSKAGETTGIDGVSYTRGDDEVIYYNLQGIRVSEPTHGIYIRCQGNHATRVAIK